jgi:hypothetical protein
MDKEDMWTMQRAVMTHKSTRFSYMCPRGSVEEEEEVEEHKDHASPMPPATRDTALPEGSAHGGRKVSFSATTKLPGTDTRIRSWLAEGGKQVS